MSETVDHAESHLALRERVNDLATRLVMDGASRDLAAEFLQLTEQAGKRPEMARITSALAENEKAEPAALEQWLQSGITQLQQALGNEARNGPPAASPQDSPASLAQDPELVREFILESREHIATVESRMLTLEKNPGDMEAVHSVFRAFHTIKGLAGFLEFTALQELAHTVETLLNGVRESKLAITPAVVDVVLESADSIKHSVDAVESSLSGAPAVPPGDTRDLLARIQRLTAGEAPAAAPEPPPQSVAPAPPPAKTQNKTADAFSIRVETAKLDYLMDMVGEMVIAQSLIRHDRTLASIQDPRLQGNLSQLAQITSEVQRTAMGMRMIPIGQLFQRTARLVRDLSRKAGKQVELEVSGEDTELDKTVAEELADPLMHMVRNAIDHGIEPPEGRKAAGKSAVAHLRLSAYHQGGRIVVEIGDDGRGLDREKILKKAQQRGLIGDGAQLSDNEIFHLIFEAGFSTAEQVTDISGRGVGMDVVRRHVQKLRGRIDIQSAAGQGTTFFLKLPLTLAIIEGLVVVVGSQRYIVPVFAVREMIRPAPESLATVHGRGEMAIVRGRLLPIVRLHRRFGVEPRSEDPCHGLLVVAESDGSQFCVLVDDLAGKQEVVIKSLGEGLRNVAGIAGGAILGDGRVGLILDMEGVFRGVGHE